MRRRSLSLPPAFPADHEVFGKHPLKYLCYERPRKLDFSNCRSLPNMNTWCSDVVKNSAITDKVIMPINSRMFNLSLSENHKTAVQEEMEQHIRAGLCVSCRPYQNFPLHQEVVDIPLLERHRANVSLDVRVIRVYHISRDDVSNANSTLELATLDFLCPRQINDDWKAYIIHLGYTFQIKMGEPTELDPDPVWMARAMIDYCEIPWRKLDYHQLIKGMSNYNGPMFNRFKLVDCPHTVKMFLEMMHLDTRGYEIVGTYRPEDYKLPVKWDKGPIFEDEEAIDPDDVPPPAKRR